jgi:acyl carrier protein
MTLVATYRSSGVDVEGQVRAELVDFVVGNYLFGETARMLRDEDSLVEGGVIDSTGILELIEFLESAFSVEVSETETVPENLGSISNLTKFIVGKKSDEGSAH